MDINDMDKLLSRAKMEADKFFRDYSDEIIGKGCLFQNKNPG